MIQLPLQLSKLASVSGGQVLLGNGSGVVTGTTISGDVTVSDAGVTAITAGAIVNADVNASAAIAYSKLALTDSIVNADVNGSAGIVYSKLSLSDSIVNADINTAAAIAYSKLALTGSIVNADVNASAAIAYNKLALSDSIVNADINASAAIAYSKLALSDSIVNADINTAAAIARSKIAAGTANYVVVNDGSGNLSEVAVLPVSQGGTGLSALGNCLADIACQCRSNRTGVCNRHRCW